MRKSMAIVLMVAMAVGVAAQDGPPPPEIDGEIVVEGLNGPQGLFVDSAGNLWVTENGLGGDEEVTFFNVNTYAEEPGLLGNSARLIRVSPEGEQTVMATLPSVSYGQDRTAGGRVAELDGEIYFTHGIWAEFLGDEVTIPLFGVVAKLEGDAVVPVANTWEHENANNPDGINLRETHPYGIAFGPDGRLYVADSAANALIAVDVATGEINTVTAFEPGPGVFPNPVMGGELLAQAVPTAVAFDDMGTLYVSHLSGAPFVPGTAKVVTVDAEGNVADFATGLTMLTDLTYAPDGNLYATQFAIFGQQGPEFNSGAVIRITPEGAAEMVVGGLPNVTAIAFDAEGNGYVAINGANPPGIPDGLGAVVYYEGLTEREGTPLPEMMPAS